MQSHGARMCGVCDKKNETKNTVNCLHIMSNYVYLKKCAGFLFREAKKLNGKFNCSKCTVSEIQPAINYENLK